VIEIEDRHRELLRILAGAKVQFVLVGGVALQLRGFSGATRDLIKRSRRSKRSHTSRASAASHTAPASARSR
jgi:hypothetical protein